MGIITWITEHWVEIGAAAGLVLAAVKAITALTPTKKDDEFVSKVEGVVKNFIKK